MNKINYNLNSAMRSLYRLYKLNKMHAPEMLISVEKGILGRYLLELGPLDIEYICEHWDIYCGEANFDDTVTNYKAEKCAAEHAKRTSCQQIAR